MSEKADKNELFDHEFLSRLRKLFFRLRKRRKLRKKGSQSTPSAGTSREFKDRRPYVPGDDFRAIDWRLYARLGDLFIRIFEDVQEFHVHILLDNSNSMAHPYDRKRITGLRLAVALAYLALMNDHRVSMFSFGDGVHREMPPLKGQGQIHAVLDKMAGLEFEGVTELNRSLSRFRPARDRSGVVFLISDLFGHDPEDAIEAIPQAGSWGAETHVIQVLHPGEREPELEGEVQLIDVETQEARRMRFNRREIQRYRDAFDQFTETVERECMRRQIDFVSWMVDEPFEEMLLDLLSRGTALAEQ